MGSGLYVGELLGLDFFFVSELDFDDIACLEVIVDWPTGGGAHGCKAAPPPAPNFPPDAATVAYVAAFQFDTTDSCLNIMRISLVQMFSFSKVNG